MYLRCFAAVLPLVCNSATVPATTVDYSPVVQVKCDQGSGTAFRVGYHRFLSVAHVAHLSNCQIDGHRVKTWTDDRNDFAILEADVSTKARFAIDCEGFKVGTYVFAIGYAGGRPWQTMTQGFVTYRTWIDGKRAILGTPAFIPGMSGGPVLNQRGEVVGLVNAYLNGFPISLSRDIKDTGLCNS